MAEFLTTSGTISRVKQLVTQARERLVIISPEPRFSPGLIARLQEADRRGVEITLVHRADAPDREIPPALKPLKSVSAWFVPNLHATCYFNETGVVVTSMSLSQEPGAGREMGVFIAASEEAYGAARREIDEMIASVKPAPPPAPIPRPSVSMRGWRSSSQTPTSASLGVSRGFCVRCRTAIGVDAERPLCLPCFDAWAEAGSNEVYPERYCHDCGKEAPTTSATPFCDTCFARTWPVS
jgi:hypothetical protein